MVVVVIEVEEVMGVVVVIEVEEVIGVVVVIEEEEVMVVLEVEGMVVVVIEVEEVMVVLEVEGMVVVVIEVEGMVVVVIEVEGMVVVVIEVEGMVVVVIEVEGMVVVVIEVEGMVVVVIEVEGMVVIVTEEKGVQWTSLALEVVLIRLPLSTRRHMAMAPQRAAVVVAGDEENLARCSPYSSLYPFSPHGLHTSRRRKVTLMPPPRNLLQLITSCLFSNTWNASQIILHAPVPGVTGTEITLMTNTFKFKRTVPGDCYQYHVDFSPEVTEFKTKRCTCEWKVKLN